MLHPGEYLRLCPLLHNRCAKTKKDMAQLKEQIKAPEKELRDEVANLSDAECKTLVIRMLTEMIEYGHKIKSRRGWKEVFKVMKSKDR